MIPFSTICTCFLAQSARALPSVVNGLVVGFAPGRIFLPRLVDFPGCVTQIRLRPGVPAPGVAVVRKLLNPDGPRSGPDRFRRRHGAGTTVRDMRRTKPLSASTGFAPTDFATGFRAPDIAAKMLYCLSTAVRGIDVRALTLTDRVRTGIDP